MTLPELITFEQVEHPTPNVRRVGFPLDHPYVEQVWASALGPTSVLILRALHRRFEAASPTTVALPLLAAELGLMGADGPRRSRLGKTLHRLLVFDVAEWGTSLSHLRVYSRLPSLPRRHLLRAPATTRAAHDRFVDERIAALTRSAATRLDTRPERVAACLDRLQPGASPDAPDLAL